MKKLLFAAVCMCGLLMSCTKNSQPENKTSQLQQKESVEVTGSNQIITVSDDAKSITVTGNNNQVSTENASDNKN